MKQEKKRQQQQHDSNEMIRQPSYTIMLLFFFLLFISTCNNEKENASSVGVAVHAFSIPTTFLPTTTITTRHHHHHLGTLRTNSPMWYHSPINVKTFWNKDNTNVKRILQHSNMRISSRLVLAAMTTTTSHDENNDDDDETTLAKGSINEKLVNETTTHLSQNDTITPTTNNNTTILTTRRNKFNMTALFQTRKVKYTTLAGLVWLAAPFMSTTTTTTRHHNNILPKQGIENPKSDLSIYTKEQINKSPTAVFASTSKIITKDGTTYGVGATTATNAMASVANAVHKVGPCVIRIDTETEMERAVHFQDTSSSSSSSQDEEDSDSSSSKKPDPTDLDSIPDRMKFIQQGQGSGIIFSHDGFVLTNAHVVDGATRVSVLLTDGRRYRAKVMGTDDIVDIAVLKILPPTSTATNVKKDTSSSSSSSTVVEEYGDVNSGGGRNTQSSSSSSSSRPLPVAELGDSDTLQVGQFVIAVGSPGGLDNTVTMGIVSGLKRSSEVVGLPNKKVEYIQTDAAINPGNSGGPLVDVVSGKIIGINACIRANMEGTSFAIPINKVKDIMHDLSEGREVHHGFIGVSMTSVTPELAVQNNEDPNSAHGIIPRVYGVMITKVFPDTPAESGGLRRLDVVVEIGGQRCRGADEAQLIIDGATVGEELSIKAIRNEREITLHIKPEDLASRLKSAKQKKELKREKEMNKFREQLQKGLQRDMDKLLRQLEQRNKL